MTPKVKFEVEGWECSRCAHKWVPRIMTEVEPTICPKCKSPYWNKPRRADLQSSKLAHSKLKEDKLKESKLR